MADYTLNTATETSHTFDLDKYDSNGNEISYIVDEQEVNADDLKFYSKAIKQDTTNTDKYIITNTFTVPGDTISVDANVKWVDNETQAKRRPGSVIVKVLNGTAEVNTQVANNDGGWKTTFNDLPKYGSHGNEINYTIDQAEVTEGDMKFYKKNSIWLYDNKYIYITRKQYTNNQNSKNMGRQQQRQIKQNNSTTNW